MAEYRLVFNGPIITQSANALRHRVAFILEQADFESLTLVFSTSGGSTQDGINLYSFLRALPIRVHGHAAGHVGSIGIPAFLGAHYRTMSHVIGESQNWDACSRPLRGANRCISVVE